MPMGHLLPHAATKSSEEALKFAKPAQYDEPAESKWRKKLTREIILILQPALQITSRALNDRLVLEELVEQGASPTRVLGEIKRRERKGAGQKACKMWRRGATIEEWEMKRERRGRGEN
ncbi:hypothetical protein BTUL_0024g00130 [Botrytis tulipae]|uniref:Uncharacterized protein n=1 Tax=Botrytis tulipae TaxID=87230 RepID=A0A4Z1EWZ3_9HELO|nr:hypothetical protein BTUL_0024g00130 [Botrytis tulipae]